MKFNLSFKTPESKTTNLLLIVLELILILLAFGINLGITPYDFQLVPLLVALLGMNIWNKHFINCKNIYPIKIDDDDKNLYLSSIMIISFLLLIVFSVPMFLIVSKHQEFVAAVILAPIIEEIVFRHYMLGRLSEVYGDGIKGVLLSVIISSLIFSLGHAYQGMFGVIGALLKGVIFSGLYLIFRRNIVVPTVIHSLHNLII